MNLVEGTDEGFPSRAGFEAGAELSLVPAFPKQRKAEVIDFVDGDLVFYDSDCVSKYLLSRIISNDFYHAEGKMFRDVLQETVLLR